MKMKKVVLITNIPTPYRVPLFNKMASIFIENNLKFKIAFCAKGYPRRKWREPLKDAKFDYSILKSWRIGLDVEKCIFIPLNLLVLLFREKPSIIVSSGFSFATIFVYLFSMITKVPYIIWSGEINKRGKNTSFIRTFVRKTLAAKASAFIAYGTRAGEYLRCLDSKKSIFYGWNTVDTNFFARQVKDIKNNKEKFLEKLNCLSDRVHILTVGHLTHGKCIDNILRALSIIRSRRNNFIFHVVGSGGELQKIENLVDILNLREQVRFWGYKQKEELIDFYGIADFFVFASTYDIWGLVVVEAMSSSLPVITSKYAGSTADLIEDGVNGFVVDPYNIEEMAEKIETLINNPELRESIGSNAQRTIKDGFTLEKSAQGFLDATKYVVFKNSHS